MNFVRGHRLKAAVGCWYTSTGKVLIQMVKYEDENGMRHVIRDIQVTGTTILQPAYQMCRKTPSFRYGGYKTRPSNLRK